MTPRFREDETFRWHFRVIHYFIQKWGDFLGLKMGIKIPNCRFDKGKTHATKKSKWPTTPRQGKTEPWACVTSFLSAVAPGLFWAHSGRGIRRKPEPDPTKILGSVGHEGWPELEPPRDAHGTSAQCPRIKDPASTHIQPRTVQCGFAGISLRHSAGLRVTSGWW